METKVTQQSLTSRVIALCNQAAGHLADANMVLNDSPDDIAWAIAKLGLALRCLEQCETEDLEASGTALAGSPQILWCAPGIGWRMRSPG